MNRPRRIDWTRVLDDIAFVLSAPGPDDAQPQLIGQILLARELNVARGTLRGWMEGSEPKHSDGEKLLDRWRVLTGKSREFAPTMVVVLSAGDFKDGR